MIQAEIITIGDEILIGQIVDTNSSWMAQQLNNIGVGVKQMSSVSDDKQHIVNALNEAFSRVDIVLVTGGLGPTKDDITKHTLCEYFKTHLVFNEDAYQNIVGLFKARGLQFSETNRKQAEVPECCTVIQNNYGTAPGMLFELGGKILVSMPGVPYEMKAMMQKDVLLLIKNKFKLPFIVHKTVLTQGIGESNLMDKITDWEESLSRKNIKLAYLPSIGRVRLRLSTSGYNKEELDKNIEDKITDLKTYIDEYIYGYETSTDREETIQKIVGDLLKENRKTLVTAESCTGGYIAHLITSVAGSSDYYLGSIIPYSNEIKKSILNIKQETLDTVGAVSKEVVEELAIQIKKMFNADYSIAVSGIAGPGGATAEKPLGTVWISIATPEKIISEKFSFGKHRVQNIERAAFSALNMLRKALIDSEK